VYNLQTKNFSSTPKAIRVHVISPGICTNATVRPYDLVKNQPTCSNGNLWPTCQVSRVIFGALGTIILLTLLVILIMYGLGMFLSAIFIFKKYAYQFFNEPSFFPLKNPGPPPCCTVGFFISK
jgi:hypothetical protein